MSNFSKGKYAQFISDRSGMAFPYKEMVKEWNGSRVHVSEFEPKATTIRTKTTRCGSSRFTKRKTCIEYRLPETD
jgi:hypothetical protein